jgi:hypothetical protein
MAKVIKGFFCLSQSTQRHRVLDLNSWEGNSDQTAIPLLREYRRRYGRGYSSITPAASQRKVLFKSTKKVIPVAVVKKKYPGDSNPW